MDLFKRCLSKTKEGFSKISIFIEEDEKTFGLLSRTSFDLYRLVRAKKDRNAKYVMRKISTQHLLNLRKKSMVKDYK
ncbi:hypothetical protein AP3564_10435 [Aeribacillus pallidus]|uniref:Uncharacterized protein n=1 Tax=Aeribacillus pallidus TaxID=33936 RepID=A0A223E5S5_9BACI|nr:hypothetical protein AP3564_10435 [Aeribacillus pallidus]